MMILGYWLMGNRQMFHNEVGGEIEYSHQPIKSEHYTFHLGMDRTVLIPILVFILIITFQSKFFELTQKFLTLINLLKLEDVDAIQLMTKRKICIMPEPKDNNAKADKKEKNESGNEDFLD